MRTDVQRIDKYKAKLVSDVVKDRVDKYGDVQKRKFANGIKEQVRIEKETKKLISNSVKTLMMPYYIIFAKEVNMLTNKHQSESLFSELEVLQKKWIERGLNTTLLNTIKTYYVQAYKVVGYFRLDVSLLDGPDVLS